MTSEATRLLDEAVKLANSIQGKYFDFGEIIYELKENDHYKMIDGNVYYSDNHSKWKQFCEDKLPVGYRTAQYWLTLYKYYSDMGVDKERLAKVGWSKAKELIDLTDNTHILEEGLKIAETGTLSDVRAYSAHIKSTTQSLGEDNRETLKSKKFTFNYFEAAAETVEQILAEESVNHDGNLNDTLFQILLDYKTMKQTYVHDAYTVSDDQELEQLIA